MASSSTPPEKGTQSVSLRLYSTFQCVTVSISADVDAGVKSKGEIRKDQRRSQCPGVPDCGRAIALRSAQAQSERSNGFKRGEISSISVESYTNIIRRSELHLIAYHKKFNVINQHYPMRVMSRNVYFPARPLISHIFGAL